MLVSPLLFSKFLTGFLKIPNSGVEGE
jgi:hypothetical protein